MTYFDVKELELSIVPVYCRDKQGTAFFINENTLLTCRHCVTPYFESEVAREEIKIKLFDNEYLCEACELGNEDTKIDIVILSIVSEDCKPGVKYFELIDSSYIHNLELITAGFIKELGNGNILSKILVRQIFGVDGYKTLGNIRLRNEDTVQPNSYKGLSGAPVINAGGKVIGIITSQVSNSPQYISIHVVKELLEAIGIQIGKDNGEGDLTLTGFGRSLDINQKAKALIGNRYNVKLHQNIPELDTFLEMIINIEEGEKSKNKIEDILNELTKIQEYESEANEKLKLKDADPLKFYSSGYELILKVKQDISYSKDGSILSKKEIIGKLDDIKDSNFHRVLISHKKCFLINGSAGMGKTHNLCHFSLQPHERHLIFLMFGTHFTDTEHAIDTIKNYICEGNDLSEFNQRLKANNKIAVLVIDALNEGAGATYWNRELNPLRMRINDLSNLKLIVSVRTPIDAEIQELKDNELWETETVKGFTNHRDAIKNYFSEYGIPEEYIDGNDVLCNPLFLTVFCETFKYQTEEEKRNKHRLDIYRRYVLLKNPSISHDIDEDPQLNITELYLHRLAYEMVKNNYFIPIKRSKARDIAKELAPNRLWQNDLLRSCLYHNLLLEDGRTGDKSTVMFEYENLEDYYKAWVLFEDEGNLSNIINKIISQREKLQKENISLSRFENSIKAFFDICIQKNQNIVQNPELQTGGSINQLFIEYLLDSNLDSQKVESLLIQSIPFSFPPSDFLKRVDLIPTEKVTEFHEKLKELSIGKREIIWTKAVNKQYERDFEFIGKFKIGEDYDFLCEQNDHKNVAIIWCWKLVTSLPIYRSYIIRQLVSLFSRDSDVAEAILHMFEGVNDPYVEAGIYCAVYGALLITRNKDFAEKICSFILTYKYSDKQTGPKDLDLRYWTLSILEFSFKQFELPYYNAVKDKEYTSLWTTESKTTDHREIDLGNKELFGNSRGSAKMYYSLIDQGDFNRYIIGTNSHNISPYFTNGTEPGIESNIPLTDMIKWMVSYIKTDLGWNDVLGRLDDNFKSSLNRFEQNKERIGKKFQWIAWKRLNTMLMDTCEVINHRKRVFTQGISLDIINNPKPWDLQTYNDFDPTLGIFPVTFEENQLRGTEVQKLGMEEGEKWFDDANITPLFRYKGTNNKGDEFIMLVSDDVATSDYTGEGEIEIKFEDGIEGIEKDFKYDEMHITRALRSYNYSCFVKREDVENLREWTKEQNFNRYPIEQRKNFPGFLWVEYPWSEKYEKHINSEIDWEQPSGAGFKIKLSYESQFQEDYMGTDLYQSLVLTNMSTVYAPNPEFMKDMNLYCSAVRGIIKSEDKNERVEALNTVYQNEGNKGLFVRKEILDEFLEKKGYVLFYFSDGRKELHIGNGKNKITHYSNAAIYYPGGELEIIQDMIMKEKFDVR